MLSLHSKILAVALIASFLSPILADDPSTAPLAHFTFNGHASDEEQKLMFELKGTEFQDDALYLNGRYEFGPEDGYRAVGETRDFEYSAFTVTVRFKTQSFDQTRSTVLVGGTMYCWFALERSLEGKPIVMLNNGRFRQEVENAFLPVGEWTVVTCAIDLKGQKVWVWLNGKKAADILLPEGFQLAVMSTDAKENDKVWTFTNYSTASTFHGWVDEVILHNRILSTEEVAKQFAQVSLKKSQVKTEAVGNGGDLAFLSKSEREVLKLTNAERARAGLPPLASSRELSQAAQAHAKNRAMIGMLSHTLDDIRFDERIEDTGYQFSAAGENISNAPTGAMSIEMWMKSPGHRQNMLNKNYQEIGIGHGTSGDGGHYWVQVLATPIRLEPSPVSLSRNRKPDLTGDIIPHPQTCNRFPSTSPSHNFSRHVRSSRFSTIADRQTGLRPSKTDGRLNGMTPRKFPFWH